MVSIDVVLSDIDINQCDDQDSLTLDGRGVSGNDDLSGSNLIEFMGTHLCKPSTKVVLLKNLTMKVVHRSGKCSTKGFFF